MTEDEIAEVAETMVLDAEIYTAAAGLRSMLPQWFIDLGEAHALEVQRLHDAGSTVAAALLAAHAPMLDDFGEGYGAACLDSHADAEGYEDPQIYPCALARLLWPGIDAR
jgi:hypothetical protein